MDGAHPRLDRGAMSTFDQQIRAIVSRHAADAEESLRTCRACGRPWPCDVSRLADAFASRDRAPAFLPVAAPTAGRVSHHRPRRSHAPRVHAAV
jgi:hypothetical protein